jgi:hypothetical protein
MGLTVQYTRESGGTQNDTFCLFDLVDLCSGRKLLVNISTLIISLLCLDGSQENCVVAQRVLTEAEMRMLLPLLDTPTCCQQEVLQAGYCCAYEFLLKAMLSPDGKTSAQWNEPVQQQRERLHLASMQKARRTAMKGVYNALFNLRRKLEQLGLTVRVRSDGYYLCKIDERLKDE